MVEWVGASPRGSLRYRWTDPTDDFLAEFDCGTGPSAGRVNDYFRSARWIRGAGATTVLHFGFDGAPNVGLAALRLVLPNQILLMLGVSQEWQGRSDPRHPGVRIVDSILETISGLARAEGAQYVTLRVRPGNLRARRAYERNGFVERGTVPMPGAEEMLEMALALYG